MNRVRCTSSSADAMQLSPSYEKQLEFEPASKLPLLVVQCISITGLKSNRKVGVKKSPQRKTYTGVELAFSRLEVEVYLRVATLLINNNSIMTYYRQAYQKWKNDNPGGDLKLPGLGNFTQDQLFFIGNAQVSNCEVTIHKRTSRIWSDQHFEIVYKQISILLCPPSRCTGHSLLLNSSD